MSDGPNAPQTPENNEQPPEAEIPAYVGRRFVFEDIDTLRQLIDEYFNMCDPHTEKQKVEAGTNKKGDTIWETREVMTEQKPYLVSGLARHLGVSRRTLLNYKNPTHYASENSLLLRDEFIPTIEDAYQRVEEYSEGQLHKPGLARGMTFSLTNNHGWVDKQVVETGDITQDLDDLDDLDNQKTEVAEAAAAELKAKGVDVAAITDHQTTTETTEVVEENPGEHQDPGSTPTQ